MQISPNPGDVFVIDYPFVRATFQDFTEDGPCETPTWNPGVRRENVGPEGCGAFADGVGQSRFEVVGVFKPGRFPTRVFFTRTFISPTGGEFGRNKLRICTLEKFRRLIKGYQYHYERRSE